MTIPPYLTKGSTIGITCPASHVPSERVDYAASVLRDKGFNVVLGKTAGAQHHYFSGTDAERLQDLQAMLDNPDMDAILMGRGGYGVSCIIDALDFTAFRQKPKWICGFSDIVVLHNHIQATLGIPTVHSPMCNAYTPESLDTEYLHSFFKAIQGDDLVYTAPSSPFNRTGIAEGILTGGNLAILAHLTGSVSEVDTSGKILFIEDIGEYLYNADRMLLNLKRAGKFDNIKGLILGGFTDMQDTTRPFGQTIEEIIWDKVQEYDYPICFNFPCGHQEVNFSLCLGMQHRLTVSANGSSLALLR
jgi:muramoyltetrapeptide carboxypeptidase